MPPAASDAANIAGDLLKPERSVAAAQHWAKFCVQEPPEAADTAELLRAAEQYGNSFSVRPSSSIKNS